MAGRLQAATTSGKPVLLRVDFASATRGARAATPRRSPTLRVPALANGWPVQAGAAAGPAPAPAPAGTPAPGIRRRPRRTHPK
jgi:hypothetical protein